jgi:hypothetical protein
MFVESERGYLSMLGPGFAVSLTKGKYFFGCIVRT